MSTPRTQTISSYVVGSESDRILLVWGGLEGPSGSTVVLTGVTFGGVALTEAITHEDPNQNACSIYYLINPAASTADIVGTWDGTSDVDGRALCAMYLSGAAQTGQPVDTAGSDDGSSPHAPSLTTTVANCLIINGFSQGRTNTPTFDVGTTRMNAVPASDREVCGTEEAASATTYNYSMAHANWNRSAWVGASFKEAAGGGGTTVPIFHRHYQGLRVA